MTLLVNYPSKKVLKEEIGNPLRYRETSLFGPEYRETGKLIVAYRPSIWKHPAGGREFFAQVWMENGKITKVV